MRKIPFAGIELTSQRVRGTSELPGRPASPLRMNMSFFIGYGKDDVVFLVQSWLVSLCLFVFSSRKWTFL